MCQEADTETGADRGNPASRSGSRARPGSRARSGSRAPEEGGRADSARDLAFSTVYFDYDKSDIRSDQTGTLNSNGDLLNRWKTIAVRVEGHCDERGSNEYNIALGQRRADSVKRYLVDYGIPESRVTTISYGEERPATDGHDEAAWSQNRRAEFVITDR